MNRTANASRGTANVCAANTREHEARSTDIARLLARLLAPFVAEELRCAPAEEWTPHPRSPLGARRTRELARRGAFPGARKVGRVWLVPRAELDAYIARGGSAPPVAEQPPDDAADEDRDVRAVLAEHGLEIAAPPARARRRPR